jgi:hypothetical protein
MRERSLVWNGRLRMQTAVEVAGSGVGLRMARLQNEISSFDGRVGVGLFINSHKNAKLCPQL